MKHAPLQVLNWPLCPAGFDSNGLVLLLFTLPAGTSRLDARLLAREVLCAALRKLPVQLPGTALLVETPHGPMLNSVKDSIHISLSYAGDKVLIGVSRDRVLGVDIVAVDRLPEVEMLSRLYLPKSAGQAVLDAPHDCRDALFAQAWAQMESCCKALKLPLAENDEKRERDFSACELIDCEPVDAYRMAVAMMPSAKSAQ